MSSSPRVKWLSDAPILRHFLLSVGTSLLGTNIFDIAMPLYVLQRTHSGMALAMVSVALTLPYFLMAPFIGHVVDHINNRRLLFIADWGCVISLIFFLIYDSFPTESLFPIFLGVFVVKSLNILFDTVGTFRLLPAVTPPARLTEANTYLLSTSRLIQVMGPLTGGLLMQFVGFKICIVINLLSYFATLHFTYQNKNLAGLIGHDSAHIPLRRRLALGSFFETFRWSLKFVWSSSLFRPFIYTMFFWNLSSLVPNTATMTYYFCELKGFSNARYGMVAALFGAAGTIGFAVAPRLYRRMNFRTPFERGALAQAIFGSVALLFYFLPVPFAVLFASGRIGSSVFAAGSFYLRQTEIPKGRLGTVNSCIRMHFMAAAPISALIQGLMLKHSGAGMSLLAGALCLWATFLFSRSVGGAYSEFTEERMPKAA